MSLSLKDLICFSTSVIAYVEGTCLAEEKHNIISTIDYVRIACKAHLVALDKFKDFVFLPRTYFSFPLHCSPSHNEIVSNLLTRYINYNSL